MRSSIACSLLLWALRMPLTHAFLPSSPSPRAVPHRLLLHAKKNKKKAQRGQGFGKVEQEAPPEPAVSKMEQEEASSSFFQSVEGAADTSTPPKLDESLPPEERTKQLLREKYGLKTLEEQQLSEQQLEQYKQKQRREAEWKKRAEETNFDLFAIVPAPVLQAIDLFLKAGLTVTGILFIAAGLGITMEAWSRTSGRPLPANVDAFIVETIEPNFTTGLFVLLGFSISLGLFAAAQLGSDSSQYREDD